MQRHVRFREHCCFTRCFETAVVALISLHVLHHCYYALLVQVFHQLAYTDLLLMISLPMLLH